MGVKIKGALKEGFRMARAVVSLRKGDGMQDDEVKGYAPGAQIAMG